MANLIEEAKQSIDRLLKNAYEKAVAAGQLPAGGLPAGRVEITKDENNGD